MGNVERLCSNDAFAFVESLNGKVIECKHSWSPMSEKSVDYFAAILQTPTLHYPENIRDLPHSANE